MGINNFLDKNDKISELLIEFRHPSTQGLTKVLVEGDDDAKFYQKFFRDSVAIEKVNGGGVSELEELLNTLNTHNIGGNRVIGIRDADFSHVHNKYSSLTNLFYTDCHDAEMMMIYSDIAFRSALIEIFGNIQPNLVKEIRDITFNELEFVGGLRLINDISNCHLNFSSINLSNHIETDTLKLKKVSYIDELNKYSKKSKLHLDESTIPLIEEKVADIDNPYNICQGHDCFKYIINYVKYKYGKNISFRDLPKLFRTSYNIEDFKTTELFSKLEQYSNLNGLNILLD